jgi:hypothetical protein
MFVTQVRIYGVDYWVVRKGSQSYGLYRSLASANARVANLRDMGII